MPGTAGRAEMEQEGRSPRGKKLCGVTVDRRKEFGPKAPGTEAVVGGAARRLRGRGSARGAGSRPGRDGTGRGSEGLFVRSVGVVPSCFVLFNDSWWWVALRGPGMVSIPRVHSCCCVISTLALVVGKHRLLLAVRGVDHLHQPSAYKDGSGRKEKVREGPPGRAPPPRGSPLSDWFAQVECYGAQDRAGSLRKHAEGPSGSNDQCPCGPLTTTEGRVLFQVTVKEGSSFLCPWLRISASLSHFP